MDVKTPKVDDVVMFQNQTGTFPAKVFEVWADDLIDVLYSVNGEPFRASQVRYDENPSPVQRWFWRGDADMEPPPPPIPTFVGGTRDGQDVPDETPTVFEADGERYIQRGASCWQYVGTLAQIEADAAKARERDG